MNWAPWWAALRLRFGESSLGGSFFFVVVRLDDIVFIAGRPRNEYENASNSSFIGEWGICAVASLLCRLPFRSLRGPCKNPSLSVGFAALRAPHPYLRGPSSSRSKRGSAGQNRRFCIASGLGERALHAWRYTKTARTCRAVCWWCDSVGIREITMKYKGI